MSDFKAKMHRICFLLGLHPRPRWGSLQCSPRSLAIFMVPTSKGREGRRPLWPDYSILVVFICHCFCFLWALLNFLSYFCSYCCVVIWSTSDALKQLQMLYIGRCESCWKEPPVIAWLEKNVHTVIGRLTSDVSDQLLNQYTSQWVSLDDFWSSSSSSSFISSKIIVQMKTMWSRTERHEFTNIWL